MATGVHIRWMIRRDMPEVLAIERQSFEWPWREDDFILRTRNCNCIGMVAEVQNEVVAGYVVYLFGKDHLELVNLAVHPAHRRHGIGKAILDKLKSKLSRERRTHILGLVRDSNLPAQLFFRSQGFVAEAVRCGEYTETTEDAYLMVHRIGWQRTPATTNRIAKYFGVSQ